MFVKMIERLTGLWNEKCATFSWNFIQIIKQFKNLCEFYIKYEKHLKCFSIVCINLRESTDLRQKNPVAEMILQRRSKDARWIIVAYVNERDHALLLDSSFCVNCGEINEVTLKNCFILACFPTDAARRLRGKLPTDFLLPFSLLSLPRFCFVVSARILRKSQEKLTGLENSRARNVIAESKTGADAIARG